MLSPDRFDALDAIILGVLLAFLAYGFKSGGAWVGFTLVNIMVWPGILGYKIALVRARRARDREQG